jgi:hypothetical protein
MKGQMGLMEYVVLTFFILIIIIVLVFFLSGWQITQFGLEKKKSEGDRSLTLLKNAMNSQFFNKEPSVIDDGKLTSLTSMGTGACKNLWELFGDDWFFEVRVIDGTGMTTPCDWNNYPDCNYWSFCEDSRNNLSYVMPVSIYRNIGLIVSDTALGRTDIGTLKVGVYTE